MIEQILNNYQDPYLQKTWGEVKAVKRIEQSPTALAIDIVLGYPTQGLDTSLLEQQLRQAALDTTIQLNLSSRIEPHITQPNVAALPNVKNVIAVASGKGGVGKSTTAVNLALTLLAQGARVGILDADIHGPNQPLMLGGHLRLEAETGKPIPPIMLHGLQTMLIGYLIDPHTPMIWRGPMVSGALQQLTQDTAWDNLDYLLIDLPPGTGDIQLTLAQKIPVAGVVIVTTPQDVALLDARKGFEMFRKVNVPVLGMIENMSMYTCSACGHQEAIFGEGGARRLATEVGMTLLGQVPLVRSIREHADQGKPTVVAEPTSKVTRLYHEIARRLAAQLALQPKNYAAKFPKIVVEKR